MNFTKLIVIASILIITAPFRIFANNLSLGGQILGEKLSEFKRAFPTAVCGSPQYRAEATYNPDIADKAQLLGCCLDDPRRLTTFSTSTILSVDHCHVFATFYQERLEELRYVVDVPTIDPLLPGFAKQFGVPLLDQMVTFNGVHPNRVAAWSNGRDMLSLTATTIFFPDLTAESARRSHGWPALNAVLVQLQKLDK